VSRPTVFVATMLLLLISPTPPGASRAWAQGVDLQDRPVEQIRIDGLDEVPEQLVRNQIRLRPGEPYDPEVVEQDVVRITHLGRFGSVRAEVEATDRGGLIVTYVVEEQPLISDVQVVGNKAISDQELLGLALLQPGDPADPFLIENAVRNITDRYAKEGFFVADVSIDEQTLEESGILLFRVREGPRVRIREIRYEGNEAFTADQLQSQIRSRTHFFLLRKGELNREALNLDASRLREFYRNRGYLDAQVGRRIDLSPDQRHAAVTFVIEQGPQYRVADVRVEGNTIFPDEQIRQEIPLRIGDPYSADAVDDSEQAIRDLYGRLGFIETQANVERQFYEDQPQVDLQVTIDEGLPYHVGKVTVRGNTQTQDKVVLRQVRGMTPGRRFDREGYETTEQRLRESALFSDAKVTILGEPEQEYRDVLIEVTETETGNISFGAGISSDSGVAGAIELRQRNFDIADYPESFKEFVTGRAFRGAGQSFSLNLQPGAERSLYSVSFREPYLLESNYFFDGRAFFFDRERNDYDEQRAGMGLGVGQRFGDNWSAVVNTRFELIDISNIDRFAPVDVFDVEGESELSTLGLAVTRDSTNSRIFPSAGSRTTVRLEQYGALGGDFEFTRVSTEYRKFWTVHEDFFERKTTLSLRLEAGYIFQQEEAPTFERFYAGGHRSFRGFDFRGVGPRGLVDPDQTPNSGDEFTGDEAVGGNWVFLAGLEYNFPIFEEMVRGVVFTDTGTVQQDFGLDQYRVSVGFGFRIVLPIFGQAPLAADFAVPLLEEEGDEAEVFSFDLAVPF